MSLRDVFIFEGERDAEFRAQAGNVFDSLIKEIRQNPSAARLSMPSKDGDFEHLINRGKGQRAHEGKGDDRFTAHK